MSKKKSKSAKRTKSAGSPQAQAKRALKTATDAKKTTKQRVDAMADVPLAVCQSEDSLQEVLAVLANGDEPIKVRLAALQAMQAASFMVATFESCRSEYIATLRKLVDDPDPEMRQRVLGILARENDGFAQKKLLEGLRDADKALVPPEKALQLLSYDIHTEAYPIAREILTNPPNEAAKSEALRLLGGDAKSAPIFEKILLDKQADPELRQISAAALQTSSPDRLQKNARELLLDASESDDIKTMCLTAITQFGDAEAVTKDEKLLKKVDDMTKASSRKVKQSANRFHEKYGE